VQALKLLTDHSYLDMLAWLSGCREAPNMEVQANVMSRTQRQIPLKQISTLAVPRWLQAGCTLCTQYMLW